MKIRIVSLNKGPSDGMKTMASHNTAIHDGQVYVWDGGEDPSYFVHGMTLLATQPRELVVQEQEKMRGFIMNPERDWHVNPLSEKGPLHGIPPWRANLWLALFQYGEVA